MPVKDEDEEGGEDSTFIIDTLCLTPRKYLLYLARCILGVDAEYESLTLGVAGEDREFHEIDNRGRGLYLMIHLQGKHSSSAT
jgi:hypothetical protein